MRGSSADLDENYSQLDCILALKALYLRLGKILIAAGLLPRRFRIRGA